MNKLFLLIFSICTLHALAQFEYYDRTSYGSYSYLKVYNGSIYGIPTSSSTLLEINKETGVVSTHNSFTGFDLSNVKYITSIDSFIVVVSHDLNRVESFGVFTFNMNSKEKSFVPLNERFPLYCPIGTSEVNIKGYGQSADRLLLSLKSDYFDGFAVFAFDPVSEFFDSLDLVELPDYGYNYFVKIRKSGPKYLGLTNNGHLLLWDESDPADNYDIFSFDLTSVSLLSSSDSCFYVHANSISAERSYLYQVNQAGILTNLSSELGLDDVGFGYVSNIDDTLILRYPSRSYEFIDLGTGERDTLNNEILGLPYDMLAIAFDPGDTSILISTINPYFEEYSPSLFRRSSNGSITSIETNPHYFTKFVTYTRPWVNKNDELTFLYENQYYIFDGEKYIAKELKHYWISQTTVNAANYIYNAVQAEDQFGNLYCTIELDFPYGNWRPDTTFYYMIRPDHSHQFVSKDYFDIFVNQKYAETDAYRFELSDYRLRVYDQNDHYMDVVLPADDSLARIYSLNETLYYCEGNRLYKFVPKTSNFEMIKEIGILNPIRDFSSDRLGNLYFRQSGLFLKLPFYSNEVEIVELPDSVYFNQNFLKHDRDGNIYGHYIGESAFSPSKSEGNILYHNSFDWDFRNSIFGKLPAFYVDYQVIASATSGQIYMYDLTRVVEVECPCREIYEIESTYFIHDSSEVVQLSLDMDFEQVLWDDNSKDFQRSISQPGEYWLKVLAPNGCTRFKKFEVLLNPSPINQTNDVFYYFETNQFPLSFGSDFKGDLLIYDLSGRMVKSFENYQNDWTPESTFNHSVYVYAFVENGEIKQSGRIVFI